MFVRYSNERSAASGRSIELGPFKKIRSKLRGTKPTGRIKSSKVLPYC